MSKRQINDLRCKQRIDKLLTALDLDFVNAKQVTEEGWYVWRNNSEWPFDSYEVYLFDGEKIHEPEPVDSHGLVWEMVELEPYGELAGPILGR